MGTCVPDLDHSPSDQILDLQTCNLRLYIGFFFVLPKLSPTNPYNIRTSWEPELLYYWSSMCTRALSQLFASDSSDPRVYNTTPQGSRPADSAFKLVRSSARQAKGVWCSHHSAYSGQYLKIGRVRTPRETLSVAICDDVPVIGAPASQWFAQIFLIDTRGSTAARNGSSAPINNYYQKFHMNSPLPKFCG